MPPAIMLMDPQIRKRKVSIHLSDINRSEAYPDRILTLEYPDWSAEIGRGSSSDVAASPQPGNAWFSSKVMSRHHAELRADPESRILTIKDNGSMHGTLLNGERVSRSGLELLSDDILTFGTQVVAKDNTFAPLKTVVTYQWTEDEAPDADNQQPSFANTFSADYSDGDAYSEFDDEVEVVRESQRQPSVEILETTFAQPISSSANTSPRTDSERRTSSSVTDRTDSSSIPHKAEDKQKDQEVTPAKASPRRVSDDRYSEMNDRFDSSSKAKSVHDDDDDRSDGGCSQDHSPSENCSELHDFDDEYDYDEDYDQEDEEDEYDDDDFLRQSPIVAPVQTSCSFSVLASVPLREPSPSDAAMAKPRPASPSRYPPLFSAMRPPPPPPPPPAFIPDSFISTPYPKPFSMSSSCCAPAPGTGSQPPFTFPSQFQYGFGSSYPTISNNGPFGYNITSYDTLSTSHPTPVTFNAPQQVSIPHPDLARQSLPASHSPLPMPTWAKLANEGPSCCQPTTKLKRKADEMSDDGDDWASDEPMQDLKQFSPPQSPDNAPGSPVWHPESPGIPRMQANAVAETDKPQTAAGDAVQNAEDVNREQDAATSNTTVPVEHSITGFDATTAVVESADAVEHVEVVVPEAGAEAIRTSTRKKAKISESRLRRAGTTAKTAMKYAAVALAGGAAGAMGTVYALASLPPDYFASVV